MKAAYLKKIDAEIKKAGTRVPDDVLASANLVSIDPRGTVDGFITIRKGIVFYGVNKALAGKKYDFGVFHEGSHFWCKHLDLPGFAGRDGAHTDSIGAFSLQRRIIADTEREANIGAAHALIETEPFLTMLGYDNSDVAAYRKSADSFDRALRDYEAHISIVQSNGSPESRVKRMMAYRNELARMYNELEEQAREIQHSGCCLSRFEMAREFGVPEYIIDFKIEALSYLNYSIATVELPCFDKVFQNWAS